MKIAIFADIHGNLPALEALLKDFQKQDFSKVVHLGDVVGIGPYPLECLELISSIGAVNIIGNHDQLVIKGLPKSKPLNMSRGEYAHQKWVRDQIPRQKADILFKEFEHVHVERFDDLKITFLHYGFRDDEFNFAKVIKNPLARDLDKMFGEFDSELLFYGHHHPESDIRGKKRYINPGSAGCYNKAAARYIILEILEDGYYLKKKKVAYDDTDLFKQLKERKVPDREFIKKVFFPR